MARTWASGAVLRAYGTVAALRNLLIAAALALATAGAAAAEITLLAFGDSLTQGYGLREEQGFVPRLEAWLAENGAADVRVINGGVSGDTTAGGAARIGWALTGEVDAVIVALGGNDLLRGIDPEVARENLEAVLAEIEARGLPVLLAGVPVPPNYGAEYQEAFRAMYRELAEAHEAIFYESFFAGMEQGRSREKALALMQADGIHPGPDGVQAIVEHIGPAVLDLIAAARESGA
jgi:acyl-CoA thioesterase I